MIKKVERQIELPLEEIQGILHFFLRGLSGQSLQIQENEMSFTDTETLFLPKTLDYFSQYRDNFLLYKAITAHLWAQIHFATWRYDLATMTTRYSHRDKAIRLFHVLERLRLDACIARELPGLYREMGHLLTCFGQCRIPPGWETIAQRLATANTSVMESYQLLENVYTWPVPDPVCYQGILFPEQVIANQSLQSVTQGQHLQSEVTQRESTVLTTAESVESSQNLPLSTSHLLPSTHATASAKMESVTTMSATERNFNALIGESALLSSALTDADLSRIDQEIRLYPEWDYRDQSYHKNWCTVRTVPITLAQTDFVTDTLYRYRPLVKKLRRTFEQLRGGMQRLKQQSFGEEIDLEAFILAYTERQQGLEMSERLFIQLQRSERDIAVIFMVDMSGSTWGWIHQIIKESMVLLCEALETLGDRYAIYGFSGKTRNACEIYPIKQFHEIYNNLIYQRIGGMAPQAYTRMGAAIRYLTQQFSAIDCRIKLLITLSDGKPEDQDEYYGGVYGIEDTRQALLDAKQRGIYPFCVTIDTSAKDYLPHLYGHINYVVIHKIEQLPLKLSEIYRKITT